MILTAPLQGWSAPLDEVPDGVFAGRMLGDGVAIDPVSGVLYAPCDGEIVTLPASKHAITLRAGSGAEILMHVGIDTVGLAGKGFELIVRQGSSVRGGEALLRFDMDLLARRAKSLLTPVIVLESGGFRIARRSESAAVDVGDFLMEIVSVETEPASPAANTTGEVVRHARVLFEHGIHARPAALLVNRTRTFAATVTLEAHGKTANARSIVALMSLGARNGEPVTIRASGADAAAAAAALETLLTSKTDVQSASITSGVSRASPASTRITSNGGGSLLTGVSACGGLGVGRAVRLVRQELQIEEQGAGVTHEAAAFDRAIEAVRTKLTAIADLDRGTRHDIMLAHLEVLDDPELASEARAWIARGKSAGFAWRRTVRARGEVLGSMSDPHLAARVDDLLDLERSVLLELHARVGDSATALPAQTILLAKDLLPSELTALDAGNICGICLAEGGPTSHVAILAAAMGVPTVVAAGPAVLQVPDGTTVVLDADQATLNVSPDAVTLQRAEAAIAARRERQSVERAAAKREGRTADGLRIEVYANVGSLAETEAAVANGAEGCGLLRTEFLFLDRERAPDETEQLREYQRIADALGARPLVVRTLDVGGDKPIPYMSLPREANPALGLRGVRTSLWRPDLLRTQLRAVLRIRSEGEVRILLPMVVGVAEIRSVRTVLEEVRSALPDAPAPLLGVMIETPAAAMLADQLVEEVDFLSIGTNDLTQYTLAMDRGHPELAAQLDGLHPAVLRLIASVTRAALASRRPVAVCGGLASDPLAVPILIGLGIRELSVVPSAVPSLKALVRTLTLDASRALALEALGQRSAEAVRELARRPRTPVIA